MQQADKTAVITISTTLGVAMIAICVTKIALNCSSNKHPQKNNTSPVYYTPPPGGETPTAPPFYLTADQPGNGDTSYTCPTVVFDKQWHIENDDTPESCVVIDVDCPKGGLHFFIDRYIYFHAPTYIKFKNSGPYLLYYRRGYLEFFDSQNRRHSIFGFKYNSPPR